MAREPLEDRRCSFCLKEQGAVRNLIGSSRIPGTYICEECVDLCNDVLTEQLPGWHWRSTESPGPP